MLFRDICIYICVFDLYATYYMHVMNLLPIYQNLEDLRERGVWTHKFENVSRRKSMDEGVRAVVLGLDDLDSKALN